MNNRTKIRFLIGFLVVLTGLLCLEVWLDVRVIDEDFNLPLVLEKNATQNWTFESKGLVFGLLGDRSKTLVLFAIYCRYVCRSVYAVAGALVVIPAIYAVAFSWIIILRREMKAQSPGAGSAERPDH